MGRWSRARRRYPKKPLVDIYHRSRVIPDKPRKSPISSDMPPYIAHIESIYRRAHTVLAITRPSLGVARPFFLPHLVKNISEAPVPSGKLDDAPFSRYLRYGFYGTFFFAEFPVIPGRIHTGTVDYGNGRSSAVLSSSSPKFGGPPRREYCRGARAVRKVGRGSVFEISSIRILP